MLPASGAICQTLDMAKMKNPTVMVEVPGAYRTDEFVTVAQHMAAQLEDRRVASFQFKMRIMAYDADGNPLEFQEGGQPVESIMIDIDPDQFTAPVLPSSTIEAVVACNAKRARKPRYDKRKYRRQVW